MLNNKEDDIIVNVNPAAQKRQQNTQTNKAELKKEKYQRKFASGQSKSRGGGSREGVRSAQHRGDRDTTYTPNKTGETEQNQVQQRNNRQQPFVREQRVAKVVKGNIDVPQQLQATREMPTKKNIFPIEGLNLHESLASSLRSNNLQMLTQIQSVSFQPLNSHINSIIKASTGSGKTLSYLIPIINQMLNEKMVKGRDCGTVCLVICPTRELCIQAEKEAWKCLKRAVFIVPGTLMGGESIKKEKARLRKGINILFSTPGRLDYHLKNTTSFKLNKMKFLVFEEADRTLDFGFDKEVRSVIEYLRRTSEYEQCQKVLVSAHFNDKIDSLIKSLDSVDNLKYIGFEQGQTDSKEINISSSLKQNYVLVSEEEKVPFLLMYMNMLHQSKILVFLSTIDEVEYFHFMLTSLEYRGVNNEHTGEKVEKRNVFSLHGDIDQKARSKTYFEFRKTQNAILISTEVASRGLDFPDLTHIVLFDIPPTITDYANRIGRTARMNSSGVSLVILNYQESDYVEQLKVYTPTVNAIDKHTIFQKFQQTLQKRHITSEAPYYIEGLIRGLVRDDPVKYELAKKAYVSMLRAYARLPNKEIFAVKKLNLKLVGRNFGLSGRSEPKGKKSSTANHDVDRKKRKVQSVRELQVMQYM